MRPLRRGVRPLAMLIAAVALLTAAACSSDGDAASDTTAAAGDETAESLVLYSGRDEELVQPLIDQFVEDTGIEVEVRYGNSAEMGAQLLEEADATPADVFLTQEVGAAGVLAKADLLSPLPDDVVELADERFRPGADNSWVGVTGRSRVIVYNPDLVAEPPAGVTDLTDPKYAGMTAWVPGNAGCTIVGNAQFTAESLWRGVLVYSVDAVQVTKTIERLSLTPLTIAGTYLGGGLFKYSSACGSNSTQIVPYQFIVTEKANSVIRIEQVALDGVTECVMEGTAIQAGKIYVMNGASYVCEIYDVDTTANITDLRKTSNGGVQASWTADLGDDCTESGNFTAVNQE